VAQASGLVSAQLPRYPNLDLTEGERKPTTPPLNEQTPEVFRQEALRLVEQTRNIRWIQPSGVEIEEVPLAVPQDDELWNRFLTSAEAPYGEEFYTS